MEVWKRLLLSYLHCKGEPLHRKHFGARGRVSDDSCPVMTTCILVTMEGHRAMHM